MLSLILSIIALGGASTGAFISAWAIGNTENPEAKLKNIRSSYEDAFNECQNDLAYVSKLANIYADMRTETKAKIDQLIHVFEEISTKYQQDIDIPILQVEETKNILIEISSYLNKNNISDVCYAVNQLVNPLKSPVKNLISQDLFIQKATITTMNWLSQRSLGIRAGGIIIGSLLALGNITVSPAVLIGGILLSRELGKSFVKVSEYETEVNTAITQINTLKQQIREVQQKIDDSMRNLQAENEKYNQQITNYNIQETIENIANLATLVVTGVQLIDRTGLSGNINSVIPLLKRGALGIFKKNTDLSINGISSLNQEECERFFLIGIEEITNIKLEREACNLDLSKPQITVNKNLLHYLLSLMARSHQVTMNS
ncbi:hypothetical protein H6G80_18875 [Nostoc sp. FACHB-87]|uniref:hypothetical protein n=1 Tax=Nostocaceae TaxID=1162 RepID=UPI001688009D|nr:MULTISPECIES: hypothetical protein [Nostocaceae]MBD2456131.1 hypothetical protein [Nostoc sp. FACHB-87]MBD2473882.1 hypothetical protein [Anabaena sp. FACHB-83]